MKFNKRILIYFFILFVLLGSIKGYANDRCLILMDICIDSCDDKKDFDKCYQQCQNEYTDCKKAVVSCWKNVYMPCYDQCKENDDNDHYSCQNKCKKKYDECIISIQQILNSCNSPKPRPVPTPTPTPTPPPPTQWKKPK